MFIFYIVVKGLHWELVFRFSSTFYLLAHRSGDFYPGPSAPNIPYCLGAHVIFASQIYAWHRCSLGCPQSLLKFENLSHLLLGKYGACTVARTVWFCVVWTQAWWTVCVVLSLYGELLVIIWSITTLHSLFHKFSKVIVMCTKLRHLKYCICICKMCNLRTDCEHVWR